MSEHINRNDPGEMPRYHVTNAAARAHIEAEARPLCSMWEDGSLETWEDGEALGRWIERAAPGAFVLVDTYDNVTAPCNRADAVRAGGPGYEHHFDCDYYYPYYQLFLVPRPVWETVKDACAAMWAAHQAEHLCLRVGASPLPHQRNP